MRCSQIFLRIITAFSSSYAVNTNALHPLSAVDKEPTSSAVRHERQSQSPINLVHLSWVFL